MSRPGWGSLIALALAASAAWAAVKQEQKDPPAEKWLRVEYGALVEARRLTHSGEAVGAVLARLEGRPKPPDGDRSADGLDHRLLDPILEPYAFVLPDAIDALRTRHDPPLVDVGGLWDPGGAEPAWAELCRARRYVVESDGAGFLRAFVPAPALDALPFDDALPVVDPAAASEEGWRTAWPVLRHVLAAERRRLGRVRGVSPPPPLDVEVFAYRHLMSRGAFVVAATPWRTKVESTAPAGGRPGLDVGPLRAIFERGQTIEGARLEASGRLRWLTSDPDHPPRILDRSPQLADLAVAYRAVAHGGYGEAYMSLDRGAAPHFAQVNYGGRLRDTALGMVSLLSDVRFKTFSVGIDLLGAGDARASIRKSLPEFRTHLERFAADETAGTVLNQQTRFWFYPDDVDLTLSAEGDVLAFRRVRMAAASERVEDAAARQAEPAWTRAMVAYLNDHHEALGETFPEIASLDESVRYLALFTWLHAARSRGLPVPELDGLLDLELPATPTPRRFPTLLSYDVLPPPGSSDAVSVLDRTPIGDALDRLQPRGGITDASKSFQRVLAQLDRRVPDQAAIAAEMEKQAGADPWVLDRLAFRAERLLLHARVLATVPATQRAEVEERRAKTPATRVFSVGIGGIDLGMSAVIAKAAGQSSRMGLLAAAGTAPTAASTQPIPTAAATPAPDPALRPGSELPEHGLGPAEGRSVIRLSEGRGEIVARSRPGSSVRRGSYKADKDRAWAWEETLASAEGPEARMRRVIAGGEGVVFERLEEGRFVAYRLERRGTTLRAATAPRALPDAAMVERPAAAAPGIPPEGLVLLDLAPAPGDASATVPVRVRAAPDRQLNADLPRGLFQRLILGREADVVPERPLAAFTPARSILNGAGTMMVLQSTAETATPWSGPVVARPGEEEAARIAAALSRWWAADPANEGARAVVGTSADSPARWASAPKLDGRVSVLDGAPVDGARLVVIVSGESPAVLGRRLRMLARDPKMKGALLAVASTTGPVRADLPASLIAEGGLAAVGVADDLPLGAGAATRRVEAWTKAAGDPAAKGKRVEEVTGPFTWYY